MNTPLKTILVGFGQIAAGLAGDAYFPYATHAQVLRDHPDFNWCAMVDPRGEARRQARDVWSMEETAENLGALNDPAAFEAAVIATPPGEWLAALEQLPNLRAVFVEKPLGQDTHEAERFLDACRKRALPVQPVRFEHYREVGLDIWGEKGRITLFQESLKLCVAPRTGNRGLQGEREIATDRATCIEPTCGRALYRMYDNLFAAVTRGTPLWSPGEQALHVQRPVQSMLESS